MKGDKNPTNAQHPALDVLFLAVMEATEEVVLNALFAAHAIEWRDNHRMEALPKAAALTVLRRHGVAIMPDRTMPAP